LFELLDGLIAAIDVSISFAVIASSSPEGYIRPKLFEKGEFKSDFSHYTRFASQAA
jgi:DNA mismatch repair ATPase MutS